MSYRVFLVSYLGSPDHEAIFVEVNRDESGQVFHVKGNIQTGMEYESKPAKKPEDSFTFVSKELLGTVTEANYSKIDDVCKQIPPPAKQFNGPKRIDPSVPLRRCGEWVRETIQALQKDGILLDDSD